MKIKILFIFIIIALPCMSIAGQLEQQYAAELKALTEKYNAELKVSSEKYSAELKASSEKSNAEQMAIHKKYSDEQIAIHKKYSDEQIAIHKKYNAEQKAQTERYAATQMAAAASAINADNGILDKVYSFFKHDLLTSIYKLFEQGPSAPAEPSAGGAFVGMEITALEQGPEMLQKAYLLTDKQKKDIKFYAPELINNPTETELTNDVQRIYSVGQGWASYSKVVIRNELLDEAVRQCTNCPMDKINLLEALRR